MLKLMGFPGKYWGGLQPPQPPGSYAYEFLVQSPEMFFAPRARFYARACARGEPTRARTRKWRRSVSAVEEPHDLP